MANNNYNFFNGSEINKDNIFFQNNEIKGYPIDATVLKFKTVYPGLVAGIGLPTITEKEEKELENQEDYELSNFQTGINLDYVSGEFRYPASSLKGVLRSIFKHNIKKDEDGNIVPIYENIDFIKAIFEDESLNEEKILKIENAIFGKMSEGKKEKNAVTFFDAIIEKNKNIENSDLIDYITPHIDPLKNPIPIKMIRIPEDTIVNIRYAIDEEMLIKAGTNKEEIEKVFIKILEFLGIGAKTNQGYGRLELCQ